MNGHPLGKRRGEEGVGGSRGETHRQGSSDVCVRDRLPKICGETALPERMWRSSPTGRAEVELVDEQRLAARPRDVLQRGQYW